MRTLKERMIFYIVLSLLTFIVQILLHDFEGKPFRQGLDAAFHISMGMWMVFFAVDCQDFKWSDK